VVTCLLSDSNGTIGYLTIADLANGGDFNFGMLPTSSPAAPSPLRSFPRNTVPQWWTYYSATQSRLFAVSNSAFFRNNDPLGGNTTLSLSAKRGGVLQTRGNPNTDPSDVANGTAFLARSGASGCATGDISSSFSRSTTAFNTLYSPYDRVLEGFRVGASLAAPYPNKRLAAGCGLITYYGPAASVCDAGSYQGEVHPIFSLFSITRNVTAAGLQSIIDDFGAGDSAVCPSGTSNAGTYRVSTDVIDFDEVVEFDGGGSLALTVKGDDLVTSEQLPLPGQRPVPVTFNVLSRG
jgi:hypothetical protein